MGLWQEMKAEQETASPNVQTSLSPERQAGKKIIADAVQKIIQMWAEIEPGLAPSAWDWIQVSSHGSRIRAAEDRVNEIGSAGNRASLLMARNAWVGAWRKAIADWQQRQK